MRSRASSCCELSRSSSASSSCASASSGSISSALRRRGGGGRRILVGEHAAPSPACAGAHSGSAFSASWNDRTPRACCTSRGTAGPRPCRSPGPAETRVGRAEERVGVARAAERLRRARGAEQRFGVAAGGPCWNTSLEAAGGLRRGRAAVAIRPSCSAASLPGSRAAAGSRMRERLVVLAARDRELAEDPAAAPSVAGPLFRQRLGLRGSAVRDRAAGRGREALRLGAAPAGRVRRRERRPGAAHIRGRRLRGGARREAIQPGHDESVTRLARL